MPLKTGDIVENYPYLWLRQRDAGETEGRKVRPVCVAIAADDQAGNTQLALLPISSQPPAPGQAAVEIPPLERRRIGLNADKPAWIYVGEYNYDIAERSFYLAPSQDQPLALSRGFMRSVLNAFRPTLAAGGSRVGRR